MEILTFGRAEAPDGAAFFGPAERGTFRVVTQGKIGGGNTT
jgi:hypothetical protein